MLQPHFILKSLAIGIAFSMLLIVKTPAKDSDAGDLQGLPTGVKAPGFTLPDSDGKQRSLPDFLEKGKVALVFYRSADW